MNGHHHIWRSKRLSVYFMGSYCFLEVDITAFGTVWTHQFFTKESWYHTFNFPIDGPEYDHE